MGGDGPRATSPGGETCPNCGQPGPGRYCPACGQRQRQRAVSLRQILLEVLDDQFSVNSALPRTLHALVLRPGFLTREYVDGRIARYIPPFRLYIVSSVLFFLVLTLTSWLRPPAMTVEDTAAAADARPVVVRIENERFLGVVVDTASSSDTVVVHVNMGNRKLSEAVARRVSTLSTESQGEIIAAVLPEMYDRAPAAGFVLLPVFAALLWFVMLGRGHFYVEHFVFALHTHAITFLSLIPMVIFTTDVVRVPIGLALMVYWYLAMKRFYALGWFGALWRGAVVFAVYQIILTIVLFAVLLIAVMLA